MAANQHLVADYICFSLLEAGEEPSVLKLHKLLYYVQAWHLALYDEPAFGGRFQAWVHGPVSRTLYDRYKDTKTMFSLITREDISGEFESLDPKVAYHVDQVLESYGCLSGTQLEALTHQEDPWIKARGDLGRFQRSDKYIDETDMKVFYKNLLASN